MKNKTSAPARFYRVVLTTWNAIQSRTQLGKLLRDKAFTLLAQKESTVREYGRYLFWKDDNKGDRYKL
jgi:hypothetical protein